MINYNVPVEQEFQSIFEKKLNFPKNEKTGTISCLNVPGTFLLYSSTKIRMGEKHR